MRTRVLDLYWFMDVLSVVHWLHNSEQTSMYPPKKDEALNYYYFYLFLDLTLLFLGSLRYNLP